MFREFLKTFNRRLSVQINCHIPVPDKLIGAQAIIRKEYWSIRLNKQSIMYCTVSNRNPNNILAIQPRVPIQYFIWTNFKTFCWIRMVTWSTSTTGSSLAIRPDSKWLCGAPDLPASAWANRKPNDVHPSWLARLSNPPNWRTWSV